MINLLDTFQNNGIVDMIVPMNVNGRKERKKIVLDFQGSDIFVKFGFNRDFIQEVKSMEGARWHGNDDHNPRKIWSIKNSCRNHFQFKLWQYNALNADVRKAYPELDPYCNYNKPLPETVIFDRPLKDHQQFMTKFVLGRKQCILACEMGTGKSLVAIEVAERALKAYRIMKEDTITPDSSLVWYIGPRSGVVAFGRELKKWSSALEPMMLTYEGLVKLMKTWSDNALAPMVVIFDESSKVKTPSAQRSQCSLALANAIREEWGPAGYVIEMTGTPAPKSPVDWWSQCEIAAPGFIREGNINKFKARLSLIEDRESISGGVYPHLITWLDDSKKCVKCGELPEHCNHSISLNSVLGTQTTANYHQYTPSVNEVEYLYKRMKGLVHVLFKKDCVNLPEIQYDIIELKPTPQMIHAAKLIRSTSTRAVETLTKLRELADGFQYQEVKSDTETVKCPSCKGSGKETVKIPKEDIDPFAPFAQMDFIDTVQDCEYCGGSGVKAKVSRDTARGSTPKDQFFIDELDECEEIGRYIAWGGFTGTIDKLVEIALKQCWYVIRVDGRSWVGFAPDGTTINYNILLDCMDRSHPKYMELLEQFPKVVFIGHPKAGGMALTLTSSPIELFYSNSFDGEARFQAEQRFHRIGMDETRGAIIKDLIVLETDRLVLNNLKKKKKLQDLSMGEIDQALHSKDARLI